MLSSLWFFFCTQLLLLRGCGVQFIASQCIIWLQETSEKSWGILLAFSSNLYSGAPYLYQVWPWYGFQFLVYFVRGSFEPSHSFSSFASAYFLWHFYQGYSPIPCLYGWLVFGQVLGWSLYSSYLHGHGNFTNLSGKKGNSSLLFAFTFFNSFSEVSRIFMSCKYKHYVCPSSSLPAKLMSYTLGILLLDVN